LILVTAPIGYGTSDLIQAIGRSETQPLVHLRLRAHTTTASMVADLQDALARNRPERTAGGHRAESPDLLARLLAPHHVTLCLDRLENVVDDEALQHIQALLVDDPGEHTVILVGQRRPQLDLAQIRHSRQVIELTTADLRVTADDVRRAAPHDGASPAFIDELVALTDGWALGIITGALAAETPTGLDVDSAVRAIRRLILEDILPTLPEEDRDELTMLALTGGHGSSGPSPTARTDWKIPMIRRQPRARLAAGPAPVLRDLLIDLAREADPEATRAAVDDALAAARDGNFTADALWLAVHHAREGDIIDLLTNHGATLVLEGNERLVTAALDLLPTDRFAQRADLMLLRALVTAFVGDLNETRHWLAFADAIRPPSAPIWDPGGAGPAYLVRLVFGIVEPTKEMSIVELGVDVPHPWLGLHHILHGFDALARGRVDHAVGILHAAAPFTRNQPLVELNRLSILALAARLTGNRSEWESALAKGAGMTREGTTSRSPSLLLTAQLAQWHLERGDRASATRRLEGGVALIRSSSTWFRTPRLIATAILRGVAAALDQIDLSRELGERANADLKEAMAMREFDPRLLRRLTGEHQDLDGPPTAAAEKPKLSPTELAVLERLASPDPVPRIADRLHVASSTVRTHTRSIYTKLGVTNRSDAVRAARALGLIA
jgi:ATP/maltotriose-dependent transcriptional regulator MalT